LPKGATACAAGSKHPAPALLRSSTHSGLFPLMAGCHVMLFSALSLIQISLHWIAISSTAVVLEDSHRGALIRRHPAASDRGVVETPGTVGPQGVEPQTAVLTQQAEEGELLLGAESYVDKWQGKRLRDRKGWSELEAEPTYCDVNYTFGEPDTDKCKWGVPINSPEDCKHAAILINQNLLPGAFTTATQAFEIKRYPINPPPYPNDCFMMPENSEIFYNPTNSSNENRSGGIPVCERELYPPGTSGSVADDRCSHVDASGDWESMDVSVDGYKDCVRAFNCTLGMSGCRDMHMFWETHIMLDDAPPGCYREVGGQEDGCYNFNWKKNPAGPNITGTPVCQLKWRQNWDGE